MVFALYEIGQDRDNRVLVLTGMGDRFMSDIGGASLGDITKPALWQHQPGYLVGPRRVLQARDTVRYTGLPGEFSLV
jgi:hypothetical protein